MYNGLIFKAPVHIISQHSKVVEGLRFCSQTWCVELFSTRNPCLLLSLIIAKEHPMPS